MNVYVLIEETSQDDFTDADRNMAEASSTIIGIYEDRSRAEKEKERLDEISKSNKTNYGCDLNCYLIEERPVL